MAVSDPNTGTLYIFGLNADGGTEELQIDKIEEGGHYTVQFQRRHGKTKFYENAPSKTNNLKFKGWIEFSDIIVTKSEKEILEDIFTSDEQFSLYWYQDFTTGSEEVYYFDGSTASLLNGNSKRTANKMKFSEEGISFRTVGQNSTEYYASFRANEENG